MNGSKDEDSEVGRTLPPPRPDRRPRSVEEAWSPAAVMLGHSDGNETASAAQRSGQQEISAEQRDMHGFKLTGTDYIATYRQWIPFHQVVPLLPCILVPCCSLSDQGAVLGGDSALQLLCIWAVLAVSRYGHGMLFYFLLREVSRTAICCLRVHCFNPALLVFPPSLARPLQVWPLACTRL